MLLSPRTSESFNYPRGKLCVHQQTLPVTHTSPGNRKSLIYFHLSGFAQFSTLHSKCVVSRDLLLARHQLFKDRPRRGTCICPSFLPIDGPLSTAWCIALCPSVHRPTDIWVASASLTVVNDTTMNWCVRGFGGHTFSSALGITQGELAGARGYSACNVLRNCRTVF